MLTKAELAVDLGIDVGRIKPVVQAGVLDDDCKIMSLMLVGGELRIYAPTYAPGEDAVYIVLDFAPGGTYRFAITGYDDALPVQRWALNHLQDTLYEEGIGKQAARLPNGAYANL